MLRFPSNCLHNSFVKTSKIFVYITRPMTQQQTTFRAKSLHSEKDQKITPLGWFLLFVPVTTFGLGCWQVKRKFWKEQLIKDLQQQLHKEPIKLPDNLMDLDKMEYRLVKVRGKFLHDKEMLLGPRSLLRPNGVQTTGHLFSHHDTGNGYHIVTPFQLADRDDVILINRGWVSRKHKHDMRRLEQNESEVEITGVIRRGESRPQFTPEHKGDIFLYRDITKMCALTGSSPVFIDAIFKPTTTANEPIGGQTRVVLRNDHLSYLITWFSLSAATSFLWYYQIVKKKPF